jgi:hypothetical protein
MFTFVRFVASAALTFSFVALVPLAKAVDWTPSSIDWNCANQSNGDTLCSLVARGTKPSSVANPTEAKGWYRIIKSRTIGTGLPLITIPVTLKCANLPGTQIECRADNEVRLAPGVHPVYGGPDSTLLTIYADNPSRLFDWDGDGQISYDREGVMMLRFLLGFRDARVTQGIPLAGGRTPDSVNQAVYMGFLNGWFDFITPGSPLTTMREGLLFERCLRGLRGSALTNGIRGANASTVGARCDALLAIE